MKVATRAAIPAWLFWGWLILDGSHLHKSPSSSPIISSVVVVTRRGVAVVEAGTSSPRAQRWAADATIMALRFEWPFISASRAAIAVVYVSFSDIDCCVKLLPLQFCGYMWAIAVHVFEDHAALVSVALWPVEGLF
jgi:hypothetical protein